jgi:carnitine 3-dehydrogenase
LHAGDDGRLLATLEAMYLHVDMASGKVAAAAEDALQDLLQLAESHKELAMPEAAGRHVGQR